MSDISTGRRLVGFNPYIRRPWLDKDSCAAAAPSGGGQAGVRGIIAGGITGGIEICITYPTEYVKTQLQLDRAGEKEFTGIVDCVKKTVNRHGFFGLYRGLPILLYMSIPKSAVRFGAFEYLKGQTLFLRKGADGVVDKNRKLTGGERLLCGLGAGVSEAIFVVTPMETIKVKFINDRRKQKPEFRGFFHGINMIVKQQGFKGLYQGLTPTVLRQGTNQAVRFWVMETLKEWWGEESPNKLLVGLFGATAGAASVFANTPVDVVKTRMQGLEASKYKNSWDCTVKIMTQEGPLAFYKGVTARLTRVCLDVAITFMIYDSFMDLFNKYWPKKE